MQDWVAVIGHHLKATAYKSSILAFEFPSDFQWKYEETHKPLITEESRSLFKFERIRGRNAQPYPRLGLH